MSKNEKRYTFTRKVWVEKTEEIKVTLQEYVGLKVQEIRKAKGFNVSQLSNETTRYHGGVSDSYIHTLEKGKAVSLHFEKLDTIAKTLGLKDYNDLLPF